MNSFNAPAAQPKKNNCLPFPAEIRNQIYELALYEEKGLRYTTGQFLETPIFTAPHEGDGNYPLREYNQLKYVSRQTYYETAGLEFKLNTLIFDRSHLDPGSSGVDLFLGFLSTCRKDFLATVPNIQFCCSLHNSLEYVSNPQARYVPVPVADMSIKVFVRDGDTVKLILKMKTTGLEWAELIPKLDMERNGEEGVCGLVAQLAREGVIMQFGYGVTAHYRFIVTQRPPGRMKFIRRRARRRATQTG